MLRAARKSTAYTKLCGQRFPVSQEQRKQAFIQRIVDNLDTLSLSDPRPGQKRFAKRLPNNTYFMGFKTYESKHDRMKEEWSTISTTMTCGCSSTQLLPTGTLLVVQIKIC